MRNTARYATGHDRPESVVTIAGIRTYLNNSIKRIMTPEKSGTQKANSEPFVSVILTSYNYARFLRQAIDSVLSQTYGNFELIVVDDGSVDKSREILSTYTDPRMIVKIQQNSGQAASWNNAFAVAKGELVLFLDSDDYWRADKIEYMVKCHHLLGGKYGVMQHNLTSVREGKEYPYRRTLRTGDCFEEMRVTGNISYFVTTTGLAFSRDVLKEIFPLPISLRISPDAFLTRAAFTFGHVFSVPEQLGYLRLHGNNAGMTQEQSFHDELRRNVIFPELNAFYQKRSIAYQFVAPKPKVGQNIFAYLRKITVRLLRR